MGSSASCEQDDGVLGCCTSGTGAEQDHFKSTPRKQAPKPFAARTIAEGRHSHSSSSSRFSQSSGSFSNWFGGGSNRNSTRSYTATGLASEKEENLRVSSSLEKKRLSAHLRMVDLNKEGRERQNQVEEEEERLREELSWFKAYAVKSPDKRRS
mmetsp:Transcript_56169/g.132349  ORF Transcript_56169/g.132349 Transcript_56169/m.132349 type:complete len:154 (-) Transcript_56169:163-624(-)